MEHKIHTLGEVLNSLRNNGAIAITADIQISKQVTTLLTVYSDDRSSVNKELTEMGAVLIREDLLIDGSPPRVLVNGYLTQIKFEQSQHERSTYDSTLVYLREGENAALEDGSNISGKTIQEGFKDFQQYFFDLAQECAVEEKQAALNDIGDEVDPVLLKQCVYSQEPENMFIGPVTCRSIEIYTIGRNEYALYLDGTVCEGYKCSKASSTMSEQLRDSDFWQGYVERAKEEFLWLAESDPVLHKAG